MTKRRIVVLFMFAVGLCGLSSFAFSQQADLGLSKIVGNATPNVGDPITFTLTLTNNGPDPATGVLVNDLLPAGLAFVSATPSQGSYDGVIGRWDVGALPAGSPQTLSIVATVVSPSPQTNTASVSADQVDPDPANNSASATATPPADVEVTKTVNNAAPNVGDPITFTLTLTNNGPNPGTGVQVLDTLPAGLAFVSATPSQGAYDSVTGLWAVGSVSTGTSPTLAIAATVLTPNAQTNTATITADQFDPNPGNNSASVTVTPLRADVAVNMSVNNPTPTVGSQVTFTVTLTNNGPDAATGVLVNDLVPFGLVFVSATASQGAYDALIGRWVVGTLSTGAPQVLSIVAAVVDASPQTNTATTSADTFDPNSANNSASATATPVQGSADLSVGKIVSDTTPNVGDQITFTLTVTNNGPDPATGVQVNDLLPAGLTFVSATASQGSYDPVIGRWVVGALSATSLVTSVVGSTAQTNTATVNADPFDPNPANNTASATVTPLRADIALAIVASATTALTGATVTWTITATNNGPDAANNVTVTDLLPAGVTFVSATPSQGSYSSGTGVWSIGSLGSATLVLTVIAGPPAAVTTTASVSHSDSFDPNAGNNAASSTIGIQGTLPPPLPAVIPTLSDRLLPLLALLIATFGMRGLRRRRR